ncbi:protein-disulfide reductase DsbD family protein [Pseudochryseolinea flava]|uniref:Disulfide bond formation protein DsbD n=1 Tax=Pseudochryseolinea flava TaxID=2059302 RepID=A0A364Y836_9BACT|nr:cytochrome c biogenesis protein CcdA [Pseudochryseolinea flava]RAW03276.1 disulfide bond formation protein DsbD [Pseudochryseolinea flava]
MQKYIHLILILFSLALGNVFAQVREPAKIFAETPTGSYKTGDVIDLVFKLEVEKGWYVYTVGFDEDCGPLPTAFTFNTDASYELVGPLVAVNDKLKHDKIFDCDVRIFENAGEFRQKVKLLTTEPQISGTYEGQVCQEQCILFDGDFAIASFEVKAGATVPKEKNKVEASPANNIAAPVTTPSSPNDVENVDTTSTTTSAKSIGECKGPILDKSLVKEENTSFWAFFFISFLAGLTALLTPCVFPMIPMTVSYFTAPGRTRFHAIIYGFSIVVIYTLIGVSVSPLMGPETANHLSTEWLPNILFFVVFIVFGLSFLGLFDITLPSGFVNKVDQQAEKGGLFGVFFMAFTLVLVSFSCTGPIVGSILVSSAGGAFLKPIIGMLGFSLAFAIPFTLFAFFPGWLKTLPKSGGWLNSVKVVLGFIEIALAFKFLSVADQAFHWRILDREINLAIWIVIVALIGLYLMKAFRLPGDTGKDAEDKRVSVVRISLAMITFTFLIYLVPGMWGAPLKALAGYLPPMYTHDFDLLSAARRDQPNQICEEPKYDDFLHLPHGIKGYFDYCQALACAREQKKPLFIDFTGHACTNCRLMEASVWSDPTILERLKNDFVVVALYVDDKTELPEEAWYTSTYDNKVKKTIGKQNADLQITNLNNNAQPFYVLVGADERVLVSPYGFDSSVPKFAEFLDSGVKQYKALY